MRELTSHLSDDTLIMCLPDSLLFQRVFLNFHHGAHLGAPKEFLADDIDLHIRQVYVSRLAISIWVISRPETGLCIRPRHSSKS